MLKEKKNLIKKCANDIERIAKFDPELNDLVKITNQREFISYYGDVAKNDTYHAHERKKERGITDFMVAIALHYGKKVAEKNQKSKYRLSAHDLKNTLFSKHSKDLDSLIVVVTNSIPQIVITTYFDKLRTFNTRTYNENYGYRKKQTKKYKRMKLEMKASLENL